MNWLVSYGTKVYGLSVGRAANLTALFFAGVMIGRLAFSKCIDRWGIFRSLKCFATLATLLYILGFISGMKGLWIIAASGLLFSILYPTLVMSIAYLWPAEVAGGIGGKILSIASVADIGFNAGFGLMIDGIGFKISFTTLPISMIFCTLLIYYLAFLVQKQSSNL